jgi:TonB family protein
VHLLSLLLALWLQSGVIPTIDADTAIKHVGQRVAPVYPPIAMAARVEATVVLAIVVSASGEVERATPVRSVPLLDQAAIDAVRKWQFAPFIVGGQPARIETEVDVPFYLQQATYAIARDVQDRSRECRALLAQQRYDEAEPVCAAVANLAARLPANDRANAYHLAGEMLIARGQYPKAAEAFSAEAKLRGTGPAEAIVRAHHSLALAYAASADVKRAHGEFDRAEKAGRDYLKSEQDTPRADNARTLVRSVLTDYAAFLRKSGLDADAAHVEKRLADLAVR